jgi:hypothetical protein
MARGITNMPVAAKATGSASAWRATRITFSLYICADEEGYVAERHKAALPKAKIGRSCVRFKRLSDLDQAALAKLVREAGRNPGKA